MVVITLLAAFAAGLPTAVAQAQEASDQPFMAGAPLDLSPNGSVTVEDAQRFNDIEPSCPGCPANYISAEEIEQYVDVGRTQGRVDQQVRSLDAGRSNVQVAVAHRGALAGPRPNSVASHSLVTEVYVVLSGSGTNRTGPSLIGRRPRPSDNYAVQFLNGPGANSDDIEDAETHELTAGDVFVIPAGTGHQFTKIDDHITYLMVRVDPDKVVPLMDEAASRAYLAERR